MIYLFISHDRAVVRSLAHAVGVLYCGVLCEVGRVEEVYEPPYHPYTYALLSAVPDTDRAQSMAPVQRPTDPWRAARASAARPPAVHGPACPYADRYLWKIGAICEDEAPP